MHAVRQNWSAHTDMQHQVAASRGARCMSVASDVMRFRTRITQ